MCLRSSLPVVCSLLPVVCSSLPVVCSLLPVVCTVCLVLRIWMKRVVCVCGHMWLPTYAVRCVCLYAFNLIPLMKTEASYIRSCQNVILSNVLCLHW